MDYLKKRIKESTESINQLPDDWGTIRDAIDDFLAFGTCVVKDGQRVPLDEFYKEKNQ